MCSLFNNESEGECRTPAWQKKRQRQGQRKKTYKKKERERKLTSLEQEGGIRWMSEDNYAAQRGWICYEKPKNTIILYYSQSVPKMCIRYEASQHRGNSKDTMEKKQFLGARFSIFFLFLFFCFV